jgi:hypothetical protein
MVGGDVDLSRGEMAVILGPIKEDRVKPSDRQARGDLAADLFGCLTTKCQFDENRALEIASAAYSITHAALAKALKKRRIAEKQSRDGLS